METCCIVLIVIIAVLDIVVPVACLIAQFYLSRNNRKKEPDIAPLPAGYGDHLTPQEVAELRALISSD